MRRKLILTICLLYSSLTFGYIIPEDGNVIRTWNENISLNNSASEFNLLVWNIKKLEEKNIKRDLTAFAKEYDLMLIQEFAANTRLDEYWNTFQDHRIDFAISFEKENEYQTGVANITKIKTDRQFWVRTIGREPILKTPKMNIISTYDIDGKKLMLINTHSINFVNNDIYVKDLERLTNIVKEHRGPMIFAGDFNCWKKNRKIALRKTAKILGLTYTNFPERDKLVWGTVDHVLYRGVEIIDPHILKHYNSSDHKPLAMKVRVL